MSIDKKFPWSFSGFIIGVIALIVSVVIFYYSESKDKFDFKIIIEDEFNLIELKDELQDLKVLYKNENILEQNKEIKIIIYSFVNDGKLIIQDYYDRDKDFAIQFDNSKVLSTTILSSNSEYLKKDFLLERNDSARCNIVNFNKLIFESGKKITLKSYLIQDKGIQNTQISFIGKIAGIDEFEISRKVEEIENKKSILNSFDKFFLWFFGVYLGLIIILIISRKIGLYNEKKKHEKTWVNFINKYPEYESKKEVFEKVKFTPRLNSITTKIIKGNNVIEISEYLNRRSSTANSVSKIIFGRRNFVTFPSEIFNIENNVINIRPELFELYKKYYEFNNMEL